MRYHLKRTLSTTLAVALLACAVMLSVSVAKGPYRHASENAFDGPPLGHPDKALISTAWIDDSNAESLVTDEPAFNWGLECGDTCPKCGFKDSQVTPVVLDMPELLGGGDEAAIATIKRKLGINAFRGSIFEGPPTPTAQLLRHDAPAELKMFDCVLEKLTGVASKTTCGAECAQSTAAIESTAAVATTTPAVCGETCTAASSDTSATACNEQCSAACKANNVAATASASDCTTGPVETTRYVIVDGQVGTHRGLPSERIELLRELAGPGLDEVANELEKADLYAEADAVREAAQRLRLKARELKTGATAAAHPRPWKPVSTTAATCDCCKNRCGSECKCSKVTTSAEQTATGFYLFQ
jgi:hypothetical protein